LAKCSGEYALGRANGLVSAVFVIGTLPYWETIFNVVTPMSLVELAKSAIQPLFETAFSGSPGNLSSQPDGGQYG